MQPRRKAAQRSTPVCSQRTTVKRLGSGANGLGDFGRHALSLLPAAYRNESQSLSARCLTTPFVDALAQCLPISSPAVLARIILGSPTPKIGTEGVNVDQCESVFHFGIGSSVVFRLQRFLLLYRRARHVKCLSKGIAKMFWHIDDAAILESRLLHVGGVREVDFRTSPFCVIHSTVVPGSQAMAQVSLPYGSLISNGSPGGLAFASVGKNAMCPSFARRLPSGFCSMTSRTWAPIM